MHIFDYIKSKAMKEAFIKEKYQFSDLEKAYIVFRCSSSFDKQNEGYKELLKKTKDFVLPFGFSQIGQKATFHEFLKHQISLFEGGEELRTIFFKEDPCALFYANSSVDYSYELQVKSIIEALEKCRDEYGNCRIVKRSVNNPKSEDIVAIFNPDNELIGLSQIDYKISLEYGLPLGIDPFIAFPSFIYHWPCPYKIGDIVSHPGRNEYRVITDLSKTTIPDDKLAEKYKMLNHDYSSEFDFVTYDKEFGYVERRGHFITYDIVERPPKTDEEKKLFGISKLLKEGVPFSQIKGEKICITHI